ncbi:BppU family phage baseplate upper protein [Mammaliicoccus vitulinus]|uniref:BppU family phage baseplate upper protein n=1 Tax=Mammaliicoccus vitulinus TaxID=71237 RepID=UPI0028CFF040|nr:BppU family phage baseplate upper protein [Mammaliicoccus vitulinus]
MSNLNKQAIINLENTAHYQPRSELNIAFSTADRDSAVFKFNVTKNNKPLLLSEQNVLGHIAFSHSDKSFVKTTLDFTEQDINGQFEVNVPNDILKRPGTVTMQVYVAEKGNSEVIVAERILTFKIEQSIISEISGETSLQYIIEFDELLEQVNQRMVAINDSIANAEDYVALINQAKEKGLSDIEIARSTSIQEINALVASKLEELETIGNQYSTKFDNDKDEMDSKKEAFDLAVKGSGLVTTSQSNGWQKVKITNDDGTTPLFSDFDFSNQDYALTKTPGTYYVRSGLNSSANGISSNYGYLTISKTYSSGSVAELVYRPIGTASLNNGEVYTCRKNGEWGSWVFIGVDPNKTETITGSQAKANTAESNAKTYARDLVDKKTTVLFDGTATGVGTTINLNETLDNFILLHFYGSFPGGLFNSTGNPFGTSRISLTPINLVDTDGNGGGIYEIGINKTTRTQLTIASDVFFDLGSLTGSGANANKCTITRIVGVRK